jgi:microcystin-dependent protein
MKLKYLGLLAILISNVWAAQPTSFTYQGKALNAAGTSPLTTTVSFTLSITDPSGACILYQESQSGINLSTTNGLFALQVGSSVGASKRTSGTDPGLSMTQVFANAGIQLVPASGSCTSGYTPAANDARKLHVVITPTSGSPITITPDLSINAVPNAMVSDSLQGYSATQLLVPTGMALPFTGSTCPSGYLATDGSSYSTTTYANLFNVMGYTYGGSGSTFQVPNTGGAFVRGSGTQTVAGISYTGTPGVTQGDQMQGHYHATVGGQFLGAVPGSNQSNFQTGYPGTVMQGYSNTGGAISDGSNGNPRIGPETHPVNVSMKYCVKD